MDSDQLSDAGSVHVVDFVQIQEDPLIPLLHQIANALAEHEAAFTDRNPSSDIQDCNPFNLTSRGLDFHTSAFWRTVPQAIEYTGRYSCYFMPCCPHEDKRAPTFQNLLYQISATRTAHGD